jgi:3-deoxy-manno-octulosonate cytidylyltransferase (CMP-KDO synthetase)
VTCNFKVIIPARYASTRLPGKPLLDVGGKPLLQNVFESAELSGAAAVTIATDADNIRRAAERFGARVCMTSAAHQSGTERLIEVITALREPDESIIVNLQGDEFNMPPALINQVAQALADHPEADMATLCEPIREAEDFRNPNVVKVIFDREHFAQDFSRAPLVWSDDGPVLAAGVYGYRHIGIYAYRAGFLRRYGRLPPAAREVKERLEQLRALEHGCRIYIAVAGEQPGIGIDTPEDLARARILAAGK